MKTLLTIAGYDPSSGAGMTADLAVFAAHGFFGVSSITALTVQSTRGVERVQAIDGVLLNQTVRCLSEDFAIAGIKIGMLATEENVTIVARYLQQRVESGQRVPVVLDPVLRSTSGSELLPAAGIRALQTRLLPLVDWVTPNVAELTVLTQPGADGNDAIARRAQGLLLAYPRLGIVVTGGDGDGTSLASDLVCESVERGGSHEWLHGERIASQATHGTGCAYSSALLCALVDGLPASESVRRAKAYVTGAIRTARSLGHGRGPTNLYWAMRSKTQAN